MVTNVATFVGCYWLGFNLIVLSSFLEPIGDKGNRLVIRRPGVDVERSLPAKELDNRLGATTLGRNQPYFHMLVRWMVTGVHVIFAISDIDYPLPVRGDVGESAVSVFLDHVGLF